jgi:cytochrome c553
MKRGLLVFAISAAVAGACDPVQSDKEAALGPEQDGVPEGPLHRPGQQCTLCHGPTGTENDFSIAGTIYISKSTNEPAVGAVITVIDNAGKGKKLTLQANSAGNFFVPKEQFDPVYPIHVESLYNGVRTSMDTFIRRDAGCGRCHANNATGDSGHMPRVYAIKEQDAGQ